MPDIQINFVAIAIAVVANFIFGFLWYTPLFGKLWAKEMGFDTSVPPPKSAMIKGMIFMLIGNFLLAWVFAHNIAVWNPVTWGLPPSTISTSANALLASIFTFLGFYLPVDIGIVTWEQKSWKLFGINAGYHFLSLLLVAMILAHLM